MSINTPKTSNPYFNTEIENILALDVEKRQSEFEKFVKNKQTEFGESEGKKFVFHTILSLCMIKLKNKDNSGFFKLKGLSNMKNQAWEQILNFWAGEMLECFMEFIQSISNPKYKNNNSYAKKLTFLFLILWTGVWSYNYANYLNEKKIENRIEPDGKKTTINTVLNMCSELQVNPKNLQKKSSSPKAMHFCKSNLSMKWNTRLEIINNWEKNDSLTKFASNIKNLQTQCFQQLNASKNWKEEFFKLLCTNLNFWRNE